jgi:hypothetical protein
MTNKDRSKQTPNAEKTESFSFSTGAPYADKSEYIDKALSFAVTAVEREPGAGFEGDDRWAVTVEAEDGRGAELLTFSCNEKRDQQLIAARDYIARKGPILATRLKKVGKAFYLDNGAAQRAS